LPAENIGEPHLRIEGLTAGYGAGPIVRDVSMEVAKGTLATVIGPNGSGKSTLLKAVVGVLRPESGQVLVAGKDLANRRADAVAREGVGYVPQVRPIFPRLTVRENLEIGGYTLVRSEVEPRIEAVLEVFPALAGIVGRRAGNLSGGEAKMLGIGRVLMTEPSVVILDEPTADLAPRMAQQVLQEYVTRLVGLGTAVLMVEQRAADALAIADWAYVMRGGEVAVSQQAAELRERADIGQMLLGVVG
jgi:branched-chain amino acid transport system ATP-binding protein